MKFSIEKSEFLKGLGRIQAIVEKRTSMPILANVLLEATAKGEEGEIQLAATDLEVGIRGTHQASVEETGGLTVLAKKLFEIIRELPDETVHLSTTQNSYLGIQCGRSKFTLAGTPTEEYPTLPNFDVKKTVPIQTGVLGSMIERTLYAASMDETRYNLNGVYLEVLKETGRIRMVATDGHRLSLIERTPGEDLSSLGDGVIIPRKGLSELKRLVDEDGSDEIELAFEANHGLARRGRVTLSIRLIEGEFPNYDQVIPTELNRRIKLPCDTLIQALRRVALLSSERSRAVKLEISDGKLAISSNNPDLGDAHEEIDIDFPGETLSIGFNARYLLDALGSMRAKEVFLGLQDELSPAKILPTDDEEASRSHANANLRGSSAPSGQIGNELRLYPGWPVLYAPVGLKAPIGDTKDRPKPSFWLATWTHFSNPSGFPVIRFDLKSEYGIAFKNHRNTKLGNRLL